VTGKIALLDRSGSNLGTTSTGGKCKAAQVAGAVSRHIHHPGRPVLRILRGGHENGHLDPVLSVADSTTANLLRSYLTNSIIVTGTIKGIRISSLAASMTDESYRHSYEFRGFAGRCLPDAPDLPSGCGGANCEWFSVELDGTKVLVGDAAAGGLKAYRARTFVPPPRFNPSTISSGSVTISWTGTGICKSRPH